jgi:phosphatidate phosphatase APP1
MILTRSFLYEAICKIFPVTVKAVYIRQTGSSKRKVISVLNNLETLNVSVCYFKTVETIAHSKAMGLI